jgi:hypothetical protein
LVLLLQGVFWDKKTGHSHNAAPLECLLLVLLLLLLLQGCVLGQEDWPLAQPAGLQQPQDLHGLLQHA